MTDTKRCYGSCKTDLPIAEFAPNKSKPGGVDTYCRECRRAYNQTYYQLTKVEKNPDRIKRTRTARRALVDRFIGFMQDKACADCGETDVRVLEFDHLRDKKASISDLIRSGSKWSVIMEEIAKCEIVCANDHRRRTAIAFGWRKGR